MNELAVTTGDGHRLVYRFDGAADRPVLMLSNSIGTDLTMWDPQIEALGQHFRVLRYDSRGHGSSDVPAGPYSVDRLGRDAVELLDALKSVGRISWAYRSAVWSANGWGFMLRKESTG